MSRSLRILLLTGASLVGLLALHVQLNLGGWPRVIAGLTGHRQARGELVVGFLPVT